MVVDGMKYAFVHKKSPLKLQLTLHHLRYVTFFSACSNMAACFILILKYHSRKLGWKITNSNLDIVSCQSQKLLTIWSSGACCPYAVLIAQTSLYADRSFELFQQKSLDRPIIREIVGKFSFCFFLTLCPVGLSCRGSGQSPMWLGTWVPTFCPNPR